MGLPIRMTLDVRNVNKARLQITQSLSLRLQDILQSGLSVSSLGNST